MKEVAALKAFIDRFKKAYRDEIEEYAKETVKRDASKRKEYRDERLEAVANDPATEAAHIILGKKMPKGSIEDIKKALLAKDPFGDPAIYTPIRPNAFGYVLENLPGKLKLNIHMHSSGTTMKKIIIQPLDYLVDRIKATARAALRRNIPLEAENPLFVTLRGVPTQTIFAFLTIFFNLEHPEKHIVDARDARSGKLDPKKLGPVDLLVGVPSYINVLIERGLELVEGATVIYSAEPMPVRLRRKLEEEFKARIIASYGAAEVRPIASGPEGAMEIMPDAQYIVLQPVRTTENGFEFGDLVEARDFEEGLYHRIFLTPLRPPTVFNLDIGDVVLMSGRSELGLPTIQSITRAIAHVKAYEIGNKETVYLGTVEGFISAYLRIAVYSIPVEAFRMVLNKIAPGARFILLADETANKYFAIVDREIDKKEFLEVAAADKGFYGATYMIYIFGDMEKQLDIRVCPELVKAHFENLKRKAYEGIIVKRRLEGPFRENCR